MNAVFSWERHYNHVKEIICSCGSNEEQLEESKYKYITDCKMRDMRKLADLWNKCFKDYPNMVFPVEGVFKQFMQIKANIFLLTQKQIVDECFAHNKKEYKKLHGIELRLHNKIGRLLLSNEQLYANCDHVLCIYARSEVCGASEGHLESDIRKAKMRMRDRWNLRVHTFGLELAICELARVFKEEEDDIIDEFAKQYLDTEKLGPLLQRERRVRNKNKIKYSQVIDKQIPKANIMNVDHLLLDGDLINVEDYDIDFMSDDNHNHH